MNASAIKEDSIAIGTGNQVAGAHSGAIGDPNIVNADNSYVVGNNSTVGANAENSFIFGNNSTASNSGSLVMGSNSASTGTNGVVLGNYAKVSATDAVAVGQNASASANGSIALGKNSVASVENTVSVGHKSTDINPSTGSAYGDTLNRKIQNVADGAVATDVATVGQTIELVAGDDITIASAGTNSLGQKKYTVSVSTDNDFVRYDSNTHAQITLDGPSGTGTKITGLAEGALSASSTDAVRGSQLYEVMQDLGDLDDALATTNATLGSVQTSVTTLTNNYTTMNSTLNSVKNNVDTGFNVTAEGALVKAVTPTSNYIDFKAGDGITVANDNGAVKVSVNGDGVVASGNKGAVTGGIAYTELRPADGSYVKRANTTAANLKALDDKIGTASSANGTYTTTANTVNANIKALDTQLKTTTDNLATEITNRTTAVTDEATARQNADTALGERIDTLDGIAVHYDDAGTKTKVTLQGTGGTTVDNVKDGTLSATSKEAVNGSQLYTTNQALAQEVTDRTTAVTDEATARATEDTDLSNRIGTVSADGNYIKKSATKNVAENLGLLDTAVKANADAVAQEITDRQTAVTNEATARQNADTALGGRIDTEITDRTNADTALGTRIDNEASARQTADAELGDRIGTLSADGSYIKKSATNNVSQNLQSLDTQLKSVTDNIGTLSADGNYIHKTNTVDQNLSALDTKIGSASSANGNYTTTANTVNANIKALDSQLKVVTDGLASGVSDLETAISAEATARENADTALGTRIDSEATARETEDTNLSDRIGVVSVDRNYIKASATKDVAENLEILDENLKATADALATEVADRTTAITNEANARSSADTALGSRIDTEITNRTSADTALGVRIDDEATARETEDASLSDRIGTVADDGNYISKSDTNNVSANLTALDSALKTANDAIDTLQDYTDTKLDTKANLNASNIGSNASEDNSELWGLALGHGAVASGDHRLVTGDTLYAEVRPSSDGVIVRSSNTVGANLLALDSRISTMGGALDGAVLYDGVNRDIVTLDGSRGTTLANVKNGNVSSSSMEAVNGSQLYAVQQDISGFATDIQRNTRNIRTMNTSVSNALSSVAAANELVNTLNDTKADASLNNLTNAGRQIITNAAINAVQEYMATQDASGDSSTANPVAPVSPSGSVNALGSSAPVRGLATPMVAGTTGDSGNDTDGNSGVGLRSVSPSAGTNYVVYDDASAGQVTLEGATGVGTKITNLAEGNLSASSSDAVRGSQLYETNQEIAEMQDAMSANNGTIAQIQTDVSKLKTGAIVTESTLNTVKEQVETGFNVNANGGKVKAVTPNSNYINFVDGDNVEITADGENVKVSVKNDGAVASGNAGLVSGGTLFTEVRVGSDGNYVRKNNTVAQNLTALDGAVKNNADSITDLTATVASLASSSGITPEGAEALMEQLGTGTVSPDSTGLVSGKTLYDEVRVKADGDTVRASNTSAQNVMALDTAMKNAKDAIAQTAGTVVGLQDDVSEIQQNGLRYDTPAKDSVTLGDGTTPVALHNVADGDVSEGSKDAVNGGQLHRTNQRIDDEVAAREEAVNGLSEKIGAMDADGSFVRKDASVNDNLNALDRQVKANGDAVTEIRGYVDEVRNGMDGVNASIGDIENDIEVIQSDLTGMGNKVDILEQGMADKVDKDASNIDTAKWLDKLGTGRNEANDKGLVNGDTLYRTVQELHTAIDNSTVHGVSINSVDENDTNFDSTGAKGDNAMALGVSAEAQGEDGIAIGHGSKATGLQSIALGTGNEVTGDHSGAFGDPNTVSGTGSYAFGNDNTVSGDNTFVLGNNVTNANGNNTVVLGNGSDGSMDNVVSIGSAGAERKIVHVANGNIVQDSKDAVNGGQLYQVQKDLREAKDIDTAKWAEKLGTGEVAEGDDNLVTGGTVYNAIKDLDTSGGTVVPDMTNGEIRIGGNEKYDGIDIINVAKSDGSGRVITGVATDPNDASSAANVAYVDAMGQNIINGVNNEFTKVNDRMDKVGAGAAAMAGLVPGSFDDGEKWNFSAAVGNYRSATAGAVGMFYKPTENVTLAVKGAFGNGENMVSGGVGIALSKGNVPGVTKRQLARAVNAQATKIEQLTAEREADRAKIAELERKLERLASAQKQ